MRRQYKIVVAPKGQKPSVHYITAASLEAARRKAATFAAKRGTTVAGTTLHL